MGGLFETNPPPPVVKIIDNNLTKNVTNTPG